MKPWLPEPTHSSNLPPHPAPIYPNIFGHVFTPILLIRGQSWSSQRASGNSQLWAIFCTLKKMSFLENPLALGSTHHYTLSPRLSRHASISHQSSGSRKPRVALHSWSARIPTGARVSWLSTDSLLRWDSME